MNTSILTVVLAGALLAGQNGTPTWQNSYAAAQKMGTEQQKPLLVVLGSGANGWTKVCRDTLSPELTQTMAQKYMCVYVDTAMPEGQKLAQSFEITGNGLVISDRTGKYQAFWHQGDLTSQNLARCLETFSDPRMVVQTTATATTVRDSAYPAQSGGTVTKPQAEKMDPPAKPRSPVWHSDYMQALDMTAAQKKPIAMVFGSGADGAAKLLGMSPSPECMQLLCDKYICVYVDMMTPMGKKLARECSITADTGLVISDRAGATQAFWHQGALAPDTMLRCLNRYCDPQVTVRGTETANTVRTSFYPTSTEADPGYGAAGYGGAGYGGAGYGGAGYGGAGYGGGMSPYTGGGSSCPSCNNARRH